MTGCKNPDIEMELCVPCFEGLKSDGRIVVPVHRGSDRKAKCNICGRMRYASRYRVSKEVLQK